MFAIILNAILNHLIDFAISGMIVKSMWNQGLAGITDPCMRVIDWMLIKVNNTLKWYKNKRDLKNPSEAKELLQILKQFKKTNNTKDLKEIMDCLDNFYHSQSLQYTYAPLIIQYEAVYDVLYARNIVDCIISSPMISNQRSALTVKIKKPLSNWIIKNYPKLLKKYN